MRGAADRRLGDARLRKRQRRYGPEDRTAATAPATTAPGTTPTTPQDEAARKAVAPARDRLDRAGYTVTQTRVEGVKPPPAGALELPLHGGGQLTIFVYTSPADARRRAAAFAPLERRHPQQVAIAVRGARVYLGTVDLPRRLSRRAFLHAVATAEGSADGGS